MLKEHKTKMDFEYLKKNGHLIESTICGCQLWEYEFIRYVVYPDDDDDDDDERMVITQEEDNHDCWPKFPFENFPENLNF